MFYSLLFIFKGRNRWHEYVHQFINKNTQSVEAELDHWQGDEESLVLFCVTWVEHADTDLNSGCTRISEAAIDGSVNDQGIVQDGEHG